MIEMVLVVVAIAAVSEAVKPGSVVGFVKNRLADAGDGLDKFVDVLDSKLFSGNK